jgi:hypothetical protein
MSICTRPEYYPLDHISVGLHMYMLCPYVISTRYQLLEELVQMRTFKRYFSHAILLTTLHLAKRNE